MTKTNSRVSRDTGATKSNVQHGATHIPDIGGKMFRRTSESSSNIH